MKNYTITVNGNVYNVTVEEGAAGVQAATPQAPVKAIPQAPKAAAAAAPAPVVKPAAAGSDTEGAVKVTASVPGKIIKVEVKAGQTVNAGDSLVILEAMKMEIPVVAPQAGTIANINVSAGDTVESGDILASLN